MTNQHTFQQPYQPLILSPVSKARLLRQQQFAAANRARFSRLSKRECEVLTLIAKGFSNKAIGKKLFLSVHTIRTHRQNIRRQLGIHNVVEAVWWSLCFDLV